MTGRLPGALSRQAAKEAADTAPPRETPPGYFDVLATSLNIMQDHITRTRLAGEPPHVMLVPRLRNIGLMEFNRAQEAIDEGRACVSRRCRRCDVTCRQLRHDRFPDQSIGRCLRSVLCR